MLNHDNKNIIQDARDLLVGKVPMPVDQCEEITRALIYKFISYLDINSIALDGDTAYFVGDDARFRWDVMMAPEMTAHEIQRRYTGGLAMIGGRSDIPPVFQTIYQDAYIPYNDPIVLRDFLHTIDRFDTDDTENIGDAYELMLQDLGAQASAGQFRTPRHIIDFIVGIVNPQKHQTILDPACGTAGFLASAYRHVAAAGQLTAADRRALAGNLVGYDISPDMVRLSTVNLYLSHGQSPDIRMYDTLTSEERWNDHYDVILANPPFMSPKGGIRPHRRFATNSKRSEVLFVDYIISHLNDGGRAGVIVPEGVIFQSQRGHTQLRKMLVEDYLVAVVSLPAGVFNPYSGVKTSILIIDKSLAQKSSHVALFKVQSDGYGLGAQRRPSAANDLPQAQDEIAKYLRRLRTGETLDDFAPTMGQVVGKDRIADGGKYNLSGERYRENGVIQANFPVILLGEISEVIAGQSPPGDSYNTAGIGAPFYQGKTEFGEMFLGEPVKWTTEPKRFAEGGDVLMSVRAPVGPVNLATERVSIGRGLAVIRPKSDRIMTLYAYYVLRSLEAKITGSAGASFASINKGEIESIQIPLPPLSVQEEIVAEIERYQRVINGARAVVDNWRPSIAVDPYWPLVKLGNQDIFDVISGGTPKTGVQKYWDGGIPWITLADLPPENVITEITATGRTISEAGLQSSAARVIPANSVVVSSRATIGRIGINRIPLTTNQGFKNVVIRDDSRAIPEYIALALTKLVPEMQAQASGATFKEIIKSKFCQLRIPLPPMATQRAIVAELEAEQAAVDHTRGLAARMYARIDSTIARVWVK